MPSFFSGYVEQIRRLLVTVRVMLKHVWGGISGGGRFAENLKRCLLESTHLGELQERTICSFNWKQNEAKAWAANGHS